MLPFATEEVWSWWHDAQRPRRRVADGRRGARRRRLSTSTPSSEVLGRVRRAKTEAKVSQRATVARLDVRGPAVARRARAARGDLAETLDGRPTSSMRG